MKYLMVAFGNPVFDIIETPFIKTNGRVLSGCSINAALTVAKLGGKAAVVGTIGRDFTKKLMDKLSEYSVDFFIQESRDTGGFYLKYLNRRMDDRILRVLGHAERIDIQKVPKEAFRDTKSILIGPILDELDVYSIREIVDNCDCIIAVDPQGFVREIDGDRIRRVSREWIKEVIKISHIFKPNEHEAEVIFGSIPPEKIAKKITRYGAQIGIVTLAERGSIISTNDNIYHIPAYNTIARDPTGCGDVYIGGFIYYLLKYDEPIEAAAFASAAASFMVETTGPDFKIPNKDINMRFRWILERVRKVR